MTEIWTTVGGWWLHSALAGGSLLLLAWALVRRARQPARQQHLGRWGLVAAVALAILSLGPAWLVVRLPWLTPTESDTALTLAPRAPPSQEPANPPMSAARLFDTESHPTSERFHTAEPLPAGVWLPFRPIVPLPAAPSAPAASSQRDAKPAALIVSTPAADQPVPVPPDQSAATAFPIGGLVPWLGAVYVAGAVWFLLRWLLGQMAIWRLLWSSEPAPAAVTQLFVDRIPAALRPRVLVSRRVRVPLSCGLWRPTIVLPEWLCLAKDRQALRWVLCHELTHLERRDAWTCLLFAVGQVLYYYLPWLWWLRREVRLCQEYFADEAATRAAPAEEYAQFLLRFTRTPAVPAGALGVLGNSSDLFRRVTMLLDKPVSLEKHCPRRWSLATACGLLALAVLFSGLGLGAQAGVPTPEEKKKEEPKKVDQKKEDAKPAEPKKDEPVPAFPPRKAVPPPGGFNPPAEADPGVPPGFDAERFKKQQQEMMRQMRKAMEQNRRNLPPGIAAAPLGLGIFDTEGRLGAQVSTPSDTLAQQLDLPKGQGVVVESVDDDSAAAKAGIKAHDILLELNGKPVPNDVDKLSDMIKDIKANVAIDAVVLRKGKRETIKGIKLPEEPKADALPGIAAFPGAKIQGLPPPPVAFPPGGFGPAPGAGIAGFGGGFGGAGGVMTSTFRAEDRFTTRHEEGSLIITVTGKVAEGKAAVKEIHVQDGIETKKYEAVDKVPELYRDKVKNLVEMSEKSSVKIEIKKP